MIQVYGFSLAVVMTDPITTAMIRRVWARFRGIRSKTARVLCGGLAAEEQRPKSYKSVSVQKASAKTRKAQTNETA